MPFQSQAQRGYMYVHHPEVAKEFEAATPKGKKLPYHVAKKGKRNPRAEGVAKGLMGGKNGGTGY